MRKRKDFDDRLKDRNVLNMVDINKALSSDRALNQLYLCLSLSLTLFLLDD